MTKYGNEIGNQIWLSFLTPDSVADLKTHVSSDFVYKMHEFMICRRAVASHFKTEAACQISPETDMAVRLHTHTDVRPRERKHAERRMLPNCKRVPTLAYKALINCACQGVIQKSATK